MHTFKIYLKDNPEKIIEVLEFYNYKKIKMTHNEIRCARDDEGNSTSIRIKLNESLSSIDFAKNLKGDLLSLIMEHKKLSFKEVVSDIKNILNIKNFFKKDKKREVFGGLFSKLTHIKEQERKIEVLDENILDNYDKGWNIRFALDGISPRVQKIFKIGYCHNTHRITVPYYTTEGELCGVVGRLNYYDENSPKWLPIIPFPKSGVLYGFSENYKFLMESDTIYIGESEKFVLQLATMKIRNAVAIGGSNIHENQIKFILSTNPKKIIICYDEGLDKEIIKNNLAKFKNYLRLKECELFVIIDKENKYLKKDSKASPSDLGKEVFEKLLSECMKKIKWR